MKLQLVAAGLTIALALGGAPAWSAPAPAPEPAPFAVFQTVCVAHQGDLEGAKAAALGLGMKPDPNPDFVKPSPEVKDTLESAGGLNVILSDLGDGPGGTHVTTCTIQTAGVDMDFYNAAIAWPGVAGETEGPRVNITYVQTPTGRKPLPEDESTIDGSQVRGLIAISHDDAASVTLVTFSPKGG